MKKELADAQIAQLSNMLEGEELMYRDEEVGHEPDEEERRIDHAAWILMQEGAIKLCCKRSGRFIKYFAIGMENRNYVYL